MARVTNISQAGVAVVYANGRLPCCGAKVLVDILANATQNLMVTGLTCRTVYDHMTLSEDGSYSGMFTRQCGLEFVGPNSQQHQQLGRLLGHLGGASAG